MIEIDKERLNDSVPQDTVVKVLLKKIKQQEQEIGKLQAALIEQEDTIKKLEETIKTFGEGTIRISQIMSFLSPEERKELKKDSIYAEMEHVRRTYKARLKLKNKDVRLLITKLNALNRKLKERNLLDICHAGAPTQGGS